MKEKEVYGWPLDYSWGSKINKWKEDTDVLLEGEILSVNTEDLEFLKSMISEFDKGFAFLNGEKKEIFYAGGVQGYIVETAKSFSIYLHSRGEDAFDSLSYYSEFIERKLKENNNKISFNWIKHKHNRKENILDFIITK